MHEATKSPLAKFALLEIAKLYAIEAEAKDLTPSERAALRRARAGTILDGFNQLEGAT